MPEFFGCTEKLQDVFIGAGKLMSESAGVAGIVFSPGKNDVRVSFCQEN